MHASTDIVGKLSQKALNQTQTHQAKMSFKMSYAP